MRLPTHQSRKKLASSFSLYFHKKIATIHSELEARLGPIQLDDTPTDMPSSRQESFDPVSTEELIALIKSCPSKSSVLHPMPTSVLRTICTSLAPSLADLINKYFLQGVFPTDLKSTVLITLLKKSSLGPEVLSNYRPISLLSFLSKLLERVVLCHLLSHLHLNELFVPVQYSNLPIGLVIRPKLLSSR